MKPIISGTSGECIVRNGLVALLIAVFSVWYLYDGLAGYPQENRLELLQLLGRTGSEPPTIHPDVTAEAAQSYLTVLESGAEPSPPEDRWGRPSLEHEGDVYYVGPGGYLRLTMEQGQITDGTWNKAAHSETDLRWQKYIGLVLGIAALVLFVRFAVIATTRAALTEAGLKLRGRPLIPWDSMTSLQMNEDDASESIELTYTSGDRSSTVRLDGYTVARLAEMVAEICKQRGFDNPIPSTSSDGQSAAPPRNA